MPRPYGRVAVVGSDTLLGRELRDQLESRSLQADIDLIGTADSETILSIQQDTPVVIGPLDADRLQRASAVLLAGDPVTSRRCHELIKDAKQPPVLIDLTAELEDLPGARVRAPMAELDGGLPGDIQIVAHPAAVVIAMIFARLQPVAPLEHAVVTVFEPASERGKTGLDELQQQVTNLLTFKPLPKEVFDAQLGFAMLPRYGSDAPVKLEDIEQRVERHVTSLLATRAPLPSIRLVQAPVFHGHSFQFWLDFAARPDPAVVAKQLGSDMIDVRPSDLDAPTNVGVAGEPGFSIGLIEPDRSRPTALWLWAAADNYRILVDNALSILEETVA